MTQVTRIVLPLSMTECIPKQDCADNEEASLFDRRELRRSGGPLLLCFVRDL